MRSVTKGSRIAVIGVGTRGPARAFEDDLLRVAQEAITDRDPDDRELTGLCERAIRNHDPCISCSAHFLDLTVVRT